MNPERLNGGCLDERAAMRASLERILEEPKNNLSDGKALKAIVRIAKEALAYEAGRALTSAPAEPVAWALKFPGDDGRLCLSAVFDTAEEAKEYASSCMSAEVVPLALAASPASPSPAAGAIDARDQSSTAYLCIRPACGVECSACNHAISPQTMREYAVRYAYLRQRPVTAIALNDGGVFAGKVPDNLVLNGADLDEAIDTAQRGGSHA